MRIIVLGPEDNLGRSMDMQIVCSAHFCFPHVILKPEDLKTVYYRTGFARYLDTARGAANLYLSRLPASQVPPWYDSVVFGVQCLLSWLDRDFDAPAPAPADTSSAALASSGLLFLSQLERSLGNKKEASYYAQSAIKVTE